MGNRRTPMPAKFEIIFFCKTLVANDNYTIFVNRLSQSTNQIIICGIAEIYPENFRTEMRIKSFDLHGQSVTVRGCSG